MEFSIEAPAVEAIAEWLTLARNWQPFVVPHMGSTVDERRSYLEQVWEGLRRDGLTDGERVHDDVEGALRVWTSPEILVIVRADQVFDPPRVLYRAAANQHLGVFSQQVGARIQFTLMKPDQLIDYVVGMMPQLAPLPVKRHTEIVEGASRARNGEDGEQLPLREQARIEQRRKSEGLRAFAQWPPVLFGGFELSVRDRDTLRHVGTTQFYDTEDGRYVVIDEPVAEGRRRLDFLPSDGSHIRDWLHDEVAHAQRAER